MAEAVVLINVAGSSFLEHHKLFYHQSWHFRVETIKTLKQTETVVPFRFYK
jgi:hypothetical protein